MSTLKVDAAKVWGRTARVSSRRCGPVAWTRRYRGLGLAVVRWPRSTCSRVSLGRVGWGGGGCLVWCYRVCVRAVRRQREAVQDLPVEP